MWGMCDSDRVRSQAKHRRRQAASERRGKWNGEGGSEKSAAGRRRADCGVRGDTGSTMTLKEKRESVKRKTGECVTKRGVPVRRRVGKQHRIIYFSGGDVGASVGSRREARICSSRPWRANQPNHFSGFVLFIPLPLAVTLLPQMYPKVTVQQSITLGNSRRAVRAYCPSLAVAAPAFGNGGNVSSRITCSSRSGQTVTGTSFNQEHRRLLVRHALHLRVKQLNKFRVLGKQSRSRRLPLIASTVRNMPTSLVST